jgi:hypothetical protein
MKEQVQTGTTSIIKVMTTAEFALGVRDVRAGLPLREIKNNSNYKQSVNKQWAYERGRQWATIAPKNAASKRWKNQSGGNSLYGRYYIGDRNDALRLWAYYPCEMPDERRYSRSTMASVMVWGTTT